MNRDKKGRFTKGTDLDPGYKDWLNDYAAFAEGAHDSKETYKTRKRGARYWLQFCQDEGIDPGEADQKDAAQYLNQLVSNYPDTTTSSRFTSVSVFYGWAVELEEAEQDPTADIDMRESPYNVDPSVSEYVRVHSKKNADRVIRALSRDKITPLFENVNDPPIRNELICKLAWETACRPDELSRLKVDNINWEEKSIRLRSSKLKPKHDLYHRRVFWDWDVETEFLLNDWVERYREALLPTGMESEYLFVSHQSKQLNPDTISGVIKEAAHEAGINEPLMGNEDNVEQWLYTGHRIRHSSISYMANECNGKDGKPNLPLDSIRMVAGHQQLSTTQDYITQDWDSVRRDFHE